MYVLLSPERKVINKQRLPTLIIDRKMSRRFGYRHKVVKDSQLNQEGHDGSTNTKCCAEGLDCWRPLKDQVGYA